MKKGEAPFFSPLGTARLMLREFQQARNPQLRQGESQKPGCCTAYSLDDAVLRLGHALSEARTNGKDSEDLPLALAAEASDIVGHAYAIARQETDFQNRPAVLFLTAAVLMGESMGGSCLRLPASDGGGDCLRLFRGRLSSLGAQEEEIDRAVNLAAGTIESTVIGSAESSAAVRCPLLREKLGPALECFLFQERSRRLEARLAEDMTRRLGNSASARDGGFSEDSVPQGISPLANREQIQAVKTVMSALRDSSRSGMGRLVIVTGGPGTGKTFTVAQILRAIASDAELRQLIEGRAIRFTAPTGKAADRMEESIRNSLSAAGSEDENGISGILVSWIQEEEVRPQTIHRLLGANPITGMYRFHEENRLAARLVISDEASMIGLELMDRLVRSVKEDAVFVLLGDEHQLPSVEAGAVLRDLCCLEGQNRAIVRLVETKRQNSSDPGGWAICCTAAAVNGGILPGEDCMERRASSADVVFSGVELLEEASEADAFLDRWFRRIAAGGGRDTPHSRTASDQNDSNELEAFAGLLRREFDLSGGRFSSGDLSALDVIFERALRQKILTFTRSQRDSFNVRMHRRQLSLLNGEFTDADRGLSAWFCPGEPVMMLRNDPDRGIFNGDQGIILRIRRTPGRRGASFHAVFRKSGGFAAFPLDELRDDLEHSFAMTIHKSQGSEYEDVLLVLPRSSESALLSREIVYTAITRAKKSAVILGTETLLKAAVLKSASFQRASGLNLRIRQMLAEVTSER